MRVEHRHRLVAREDHDLAIAVLVERPADAGCQRRQGGGAVGFVKRPDGTVHNVTTGETVTMTDERLEIDATIAGGSGFGSPHERALEDIAADLENGYITAEGAARDYGCVMTADGRIDIEATLRQRELTPSGAK